MACITSDSRVMLTVKQDDKFTNVVYANVHFVYRVCDGSAGALVVSRVWKTSQMCLQCAFVWLERCRCAHAIWTHWAQQMRCTQRRGRFRSHMCWCWVALRSHKKQAFLRVQFYPVHTASPRDIFASVPSMAFTQTFR